MGVFGAILGWLGRSPIGQLAFTLIVEKFSSMIKESIAREKLRRQSVIDAGKSTEGLRNAKTSEEVDAATDSALDGF